MNDFWKKAGVVLKALPTRAAAVVALLTTVSLEVVPVLPVTWQLKVGAWVASAIGGITAVVAVISRVTPILWPEDKGLLPKDDTIDPEVGPDDWDTFVEKLNS